MDDAQTYQAGPPASDTKEPAPTRPPPPLRRSPRGWYRIIAACLIFALPALAVGLVLIVVIWPQVSLKEGPFRIGMSDIKLEQSGRLTMLNARFEGVDDKNQPYTLTADEARQSTAVSDLVELELPKGDLLQEGGAWLALTAREGLYNRFAELLDLTGDVSLFHDQGFELHTESAQVDLEGGTAYGYEPVQGHGPDGTITSKGFRLLNRGEIIVFTGESRLVIYSDEPEETE